ncbi:polyprenol monophosphomannose synthase [Candidatus Peregrinibacteria bacterium]|nr:polyprenol monophosphomannose synthase [Candidatus Peregrinibacteria bacterium]MBI4129602.1 polyprenol monophosphomannose synthase [Candidatus Peregrinibacteria bacterium]
MLSLVLPTYNEAENLPGLLEEIEGTVRDIPFEIIIVDDDSPDRTWEVAELLAEGRPYLRVLRRVGRRGLSSAVIDGFHLAQGDVLVAMDSDGQHDPALLPHLYAAIHSGAGVALGSRYILGGSVEGWARARHVLSYIATGFAWLVTRTCVKDPMSGFFAVDRRLYLSLRETLRPQGFKILLEILAALPPDIRVQEVPLVFRVRREGESKLSWHIEFQFFFQMMRLLLRRRALEILCLCIVLLVFFVLVPRAWSLRFLYLDRAVRLEVQSSLLRFREERGWLLSDVELREVRRDGFRFLHRQHLRGADPVECFTYFFTDRVLRSCAPDFPPPRGEG